MEVSTVRAFLGTKPPIRFGIQAGMRRQASVVLLACHDVTVDKKTFTQR